MGSIQAEPLFWSPPKITPIPHDWSHVVWDTRLPVNRTSVSVLFDRIFYSLIMHRAGQKLGTHVTRETALTAIPGRNTMRAKGVYKCSEIQEITSSSQLNF